MKYVEKSNLPISTDTVLIGRKYYEILEIGLKNLGLYPSCVPDNPHVDKRLSGHADLSVFHPGGNEIFLANYLKGSSFAKHLIEIGMNVNCSQAVQGEKYPEDAAMNMCVCGNHLIYNEKSADPIIVNILTNERGFIPVKVKQGYCKCSVCVIGEESIITSDAGIHRAAEKAGLESLLIRPGYFSLEGFGYGFIGGASFMVDKNTLAFTGNLYNHPDKKFILNHLSLHNISPVYITKFPAFDIGSAIQIVEK